MAQKVLSLIVLCALTYLQVQGLILDPTTTLANLRTSINSCEGQFICEVVTTPTNCSVSCINADQYCDGVAQCPHGQDEHNCPERCSGLVICPDGETCGKPCDGKATCAGGEDEQNCGTKCAINEFLCSDRENCSISCDGIAQCAGGEDELHCPPTCLTNQTLCPDGLSCATPCDGIEECTKGEDEDDCPFQCRCSRMEYRCEVRQKCLNRTDVCEGTGDAAATSCFEGDEIGDDEANEFLGYQCTP